MRKLSTKITENPHGGDLAVLPPCAPVAFDDVVHGHQDQLPWSKTIGKTGFEEGPLLTRQRTTVSRINFTTIIVSVSDPRKGPFS